MKQFYLFLVIIVLGVSMQTQAQLKVKSDTGKIIVGTETDPSITVYDPGNKITVGIFGPNGDWRTGSKLSFGDFGGTTHWSTNVFIGEYTLGDTDQMWLHGKLGTYFTQGNGTASEIVAFYDPAVDTRFNFNVPVHTTGLYTTSDGRLKTNVAKVANPLSLLSRLNGVSYDFTPRSPVSSEGQAVESGPLSAKEMKAKAVFDELEAKKQKDKKQIGFIAQDLQKVFPELVLEDKDGYLSVNYTGLIPVIVEALKEQQTVIVEQAAAINGLKGELAKLKKESSSSTLRSTGSSDSQSSPSLELEAATLYQNSPNPFTQSTSIQFYLPQETREAVLYIFDMQGKLIKEVSITGRGKGAVSVNGSELNAGMYIYSLFAEGNEVDTKRMILTK